MKILHKSLILLIISSSHLLSYEVLDSWYEGDKKMYKVSCENGDWGFVTDYGSSQPSIRYWSSSPNQGHPTLDAAARAVCGE